MMKRPIAIQSFLKRQAAPFLLLLLCAAAGWMDSTVRAADGKPNVLFIAVDDLNDWIGCLGGNPQCRTPHIDALAARGTLFYQAHCAAPACNPSRAALMTGVRPWTSGVYLNPQPWRPAMPEITTLPQVFRKAGYHVVGGGKIYHGRYNDDASWDSYLSGVSGDPKPARKVLQDPHSRAGGIIWGRLQVKDEEMRDHQVVSWAADYLQQDHEQPFFLACGIYRPHMPWQVPDKYYDMYPLDAIQLPKSPDNDLQDLPPAAVKMARPGGDHATILKSENWKYAVQGYLASIAFADAQVGRLMAALDRSPHKDNTIVVLWGDHGWHLGEKQHWRKFALWEEATRAPLMFVAPGVTKAGSVCKTPVDFMSIYSTLTELCQLEAPGHVEGQSLTKLLKDAEAPWSRPAITTHGRGNHAVRDARWRLIRYENGDTELYDHDQDPNEWSNLAADPKHAATVARLSQWLPKSEAPNAAFDASLRKSKKSPKKAGKGKTARKTKAGSDKE